MTATVIPPQEREGVPPGEGAVYFTAEQLGELRAFSERFDRYLRSDRGISPAAGPGGASAAPATAVPAAPVVETDPPGSLPDSVLSGLRSREDWRMIAEAISQAARAERNISPALPLSEAALIRSGARVERQILTASGFHLPGGRLVRVSEAVNTTEFPQLLRSGLRTILFNAFAGTPSTWDRLAYSVPSNNQAEVWMEMSRLGLLPVVGELEEYPEVQTTLLPQKRVSNVKYGAIIRISEEMIRFDKTNLIMQIPQDRGGAAAATIEDACYDELRTTGRYDKTSADNNIGNNTATATFTPGGFLNAWEIITTMFDPRANRYLGIVPNTLIVGGGLTTFANQLFRSRGIQSGEDAVGVLGGVGDSNPYQGMVSEIITSPYMARYEWILATKQKGFVHQEVDPLSLVDKVAASDDQHFRRDAYEYKVRLWFAFGLHDSRGWYYSDSTTAPAWS